MRWDKKETETLVERVYGVERSQRIAPAMRSIQDRMNYAHFHYHEFKALLQGYVDGTLSKLPSMLLAMWGDDEDVDQFNTFMMASGAHILACVQSIHAVGDLLANSVYLGTDLPPTETKKQQRSPYLHDLCKRLQSDSKMEDLSRHLAGILDAKGYKHVEALCNLAKHQRIIRPALHESHVLTGPERYGVVFQPCDYKAQHYPAVAVTELLPNTFDPLSRAVVDIGNALNAYLRTRASS